MSHLKNMIHPGHATVVVGGQFGSEAKGMAAAALSSYYTPHKHKNMVCTTNAGAQAGHTTVMPNGDKFICYHLPTLGVLQRSSIIYINAGSIINQDLLDKEIKSVARVMGEPEHELRQRITIHPAAAMILPRHLETEETATRAIGSTMKGVGAALADKIMRKSDAIARNSMRSDIVGGVNELCLNEMMRNGASVTVEIPQGTSLSIGSSGMYPYVTSRECWLGQGLTDAGIHPEFLSGTLMVCRTFPIRVGHIYDHTGERVGYSGPFYEDSRELDWNDFPGIEPERTTVTQRVRRIATWSDTQYARALMFNRPNMVMLTFVNYLNTFNDFETHVIRMHDVEQEVLGRKVAHVYSWGPRTDQHSSDFDVASCFTLDGVPF